MFVILLDHVQEVLLSSLLHIVVFRRRLLSLQSSNLLRQLFLQAKYSVLDALY